MDRKFIFLFILFLGNGCSFGQYLKYQEMVDLLYAADDRSKAEAFLEEKGFENIWSEEHGDSYSLDYSKYIEHEDYGISLTADFYTGTFTAVEFSSNDEIREYYENVLKSKGYILVNSHNDGKGGSAYEYAGRDLDVTILQEPASDGITIYKIIFRRY